LHVDYTLDYESGDVTLAEEDEDENDLEKSLREILPSEGHRKKVQSEDGVVYASSTVGEFTLLVTPRECLGVYPCRIDPLCFLAGWRKRRLNQAFSFVLVYTVSQKKTSPFLYLL